jgi:Ca-activated chloride channel homolog
MMNHASNRDLESIRRGNVYNIDPNGSSKIKGIRIMNKLNVCVKSDVSNVIFNQNCHINVMASLSAPDVEDASKRNPLSICAVIDHSGSMEGDKMEHVRRSMWKMIDHMTDNDSLSFVFFNSSVKTVQFRRMSSANKETMKQEIAKLAAGGSTDIGSAIMAANRLFDGYEGQTGSIERIMLLTDGQANYGAMEMNQFKPIIEKTRKGVSLSTFGYGLGFNEDLLTSISKQGKGNNYFIENPDGVAKVFAVELGGLLTCFAQDMILSIKTHKGFSITNVLNDLDVSTHQDNDGELVTDINVGDIYAGEHRDVIVRFEFEKRSQALPRPIVAADINVSYRSMEDAETKLSENKVKIEVVKTASEVTKERDKDITEQVAILEAAAAMSKAKQMADAGNWQGAQTYIRTASLGLDKIGTVRTNIMSSSMLNYCCDIDSSYTAGSNLSKGIGSYASSNSSRGIHAVGNKASDTVDFKLNNVMSGLVDSFSDGGTQDAIVEDQSADQELSASSPVTTSGYTKTRLSK